MHLRAAASDDYHAGFEVQASASFAALAVTNDDRSNVCLASCDFLQMPFHRRRHTAKETIRGRRAYVHDKIIVFLAGRFGSKAIRAIDLGVPVIVA